MEFSLDGNKTTANFSRDASVTKPHFTYFASPVLNAGNHTLVAKILTVTGSTSPAAQIDYITYKPSFLTAQDKPNFGSALANATQSAGSPGATSGSPSASGSPTIGTTSRRSRPVGAIVGGVIAGCLLVAFILVVIWLVRRKRRPKPELGLCSLGSPCVADIIFRHRAIHLTAHSIRSVAVEGFPGTHSCVGGQCAELRPGGRASPATTESRRRNPRSRNSTRWRWRNVGEPR
jgi:hypothetical protein